MSDPYEGIAERLVSIEEELRDLAYERLREVARAPDDDRGIAAAAEEKRILQARRAIAKAIHALAPAPAEDEAHSMGGPRYKSMIFDSARWDGFALRADDIIISTPPKCGTTWMQMICALLVFQTPTFDRPLDLISPWLDMLTRDVVSVRADLDAQTHRRFIKSHTPYDALPHDPSVTYIAIGRDPRDVFRSWDNHWANMNVLAVIAAREQAVGLDDVMDQLAQGPPTRPEHEIDRFWLWVDDATPVTDAMSLEATLHHLQTFWAIREEPNVVLLHYNDLRADLDGEMRRLAERLGIAVDEARWPALVEAATFERMRENADTIAPDTSHEIWISNRQFFNRGYSGQWRDILDDQDLVRYERRVAELAPPDLVHWLHHGRLDPRVDARI